MDSTKFNFNTVSEEQIQSMFKNCIVHKEYDFTLSYWDCSKVLSNISLDTVEKINYCVKNNIDYSFTSPITKLPSVFVRKSEHPFLFD